MRSWTFAEYLAQAPLGLIPHNADQYRREIYDSFSAGVTVFLDKAAKDGRPFELDLVFADKPGLNAFAASFTDTDIIALHRDVIPILLGTARAIMSHPEVYPGIGTVELPPRYAGGTSKAVVSGQIFFGAEPLEDLVRENLAVLITRIAIWFIINHELAHILGGHTRWLNSQGRLSLIAEIDDGNYPSIAGMERETLEWDADSFAVAQTLSDVLMPKVSRVGGRDTWELPDFGTTIDAIDCLTAALLICAKYFACRESKDLNDPAPRVHPHAVIRLCNVVFTVDHNISFRTGGGFGYGSHMLSRINVLDEVWCKIFGEDSRIDWQSAEPVARARLGRYKLMWAQLHPELSNHNRGVQLAPAMPQVHPAFPESDVLG